VDVECGVEIIAAKPEAVMVIPTITHPSDTPQFALRLPAIASLRRPALLLMQGARSAGCANSACGMTRVTCWYAPPAGQAIPHFQLMEYRDSDHF
jgi:hypothetical protein